MKLKMDHLKSLSQSDLWKITGGPISKEKVDIDGHYGGNYSRSSHAYRSPTENLNEEISLINKVYGIDNKEILTIACSGDPIIGFLINGARYVTAIDISSAATMWAELKTRAWNSLSPDEFGLFIDDVVFACKTPFEDKRDRVLGIISLYKKVREHVSSETASFFDSYLNTDGLCEDPTATRPTLFKARRYYKDDLPYHEQTSRDIDFGSNSMILNIDLETFLVQTEGKFDIFYCSNALDYVYNDVEFSENKDVAMRRYSSLLDKMKNRLTKHGQIVTYSFNHLEENLTIYRQAAEGTGMNVDVHEVTSRVAKKDFVVVYSNI